MHTHHYHYEKFNPYCQCMFFNTIAGVKLGNFFTESRTVFWTYFILLSQSRNFFKQLIKYIVKEDLKIIWMNLLSKMARIASYWVCFSSSRIHLHTCRVQNFTCLNGKHLQQIIALEMKIARRGLFIASMVRLAAPETHNHASSFWST